MLCVDLYRNQMGERLTPGSYFQYPPSGVHASPHRSSSLPLDRERSVFFFFSRLQAYPFCFTESSKCFLFTYLLIWVSGQCFDFVFVEVSID